MKVVIPVTQFEKGAGYFFNNGQLNRIDGKLYRCHSHKHVQTQVGGEEVTCVEMYVEPILDLKSVQED